ncbi:MAG: hypothetical protein KBD63_01630 [Bacteriovoracaceae bacterium]|nr:hypothetical protein [Bacteriovoracaceae bacterium]
MQSLKLNKLVKILNIEDVLFLDQVDLSAYSTMKLKATGSLIEVQSKVALKKVLTTLLKEEIDYRVLGWGANQILPIHSDIPYLKINFPFNLEDLKSAKSSGEVYVLPASLGLNTLTAHAQKFGLSGWEVFTGIPATLGGAVFMNAGTALGEIGSLIKKVKFFTKQAEEKEVIIEKGSFSYRKNHFLNTGDVIYEVEMVHHGFNPEISTKIKNYMDYRMRTQPLKAKTCGCAFKNISSSIQAGHFLDLVGLKGFTYKGLRISPIHANFLENLGLASDQDVKEFLSVIEREVFLQYGVTFDLEIKLS